MKGLTNRSSQSASGGPPGAFDFIKLFSKFAALAVAYDVFFPRKHPSGFPSMSRCFPRAPFSFWQAIGVFGPPDRGKGQSLDH
jgi:hypothetical protein